MFASEPSEASAFTSTRFRPARTGTKAWKLPSGLSRTSGALSCVVRFTTPTSSTLANEVAWSAAAIAPGSTTGV